MKGQPEDENIEHNLTPSTWWTCRAWLGEDITMKNLSSWYY
jgi:hypothetical protein